MGLGQLYQGKKLRGFAFCFAGALTSFLSSWYIIVPARLEALASGSHFSSPYMLSFLSSTGMNASLASKLSVDLMGVVLVLWAIQLFDAMGPLAKNQTTSLVSSVGQNISVPRPMIGRNTGLESTSPVPPAQASK